MTLNQIIEHAKRLVEENPAAGDMEVYVQDDQAGSYEIGGPSIELINNDYYVEWGALLSVKEDLEEQGEEKEVVIFSADN